jgi:hypothetical protein
LSSEVLSDESRLESEFPQEATTRRFIVRTTRCAILAAIFSAVFIAGCGDGDAPKPVDLTPKGEAPEGKGMLGDQMKAAKIKGTLPEQRKTR